jgi:hypothetical protein
VDRQIAQRKQMVKHRNILKGVDFAVWQISLENTPFCNHVANCSNSVSSLDGAIRPGVQVVQAQRHAGRTDMKASKKGQAGSIGRKNKQERQTGSIGRKNRQERQTGSIGR